MIPIMQQFLSRPQMFKQQFDAFAQNFKNSNPQQMVQNLLNSGKMTQAQFNQYRNVANQITGMRL